MATTSFGSIGTFGIVKRQRSRERLMPKSQQVAKIKQMLSNRGYSVHEEDIDDLVDPTLHYSENKAEVLRHYGALQKQPSKRMFREMQCDSLHTQCHVDGLEACEVACEECKIEVACDKAENIKKEIEKHGKRLTWMEKMKMQIKTEAKRPLMKAKYGVGQIVKCQEGYMCGFSGVSTITEVKQYPDYVMYGIKSKAQGFVDEEWIERVKGKTMKELPKITKVSMEKAIRKVFAKKIAIGDAIRETFVLLGIQDKNKIESQWDQENIKVWWDIYDSLKKSGTITQTNEGMMGVGYAVLTKKPMLKEKQKTTKPPKGKSTYVMFKDVKKHRMRCPICGRAAPDNFCMVHSDVEAIDLETSKKAQKMVAENLDYHKEWEIKHPEEAKPGREAEKELLKRVVPYMTEEEKRAEKTKPKKIKDFTKKKIAKPKSKPKKRKILTMEEKVIKELNKEEKDKSFIHKSNEYEKAVEKYYKKRFDTCVIPIPKPPIPTPTKVIKPVKKVKAKPSLQKQALPKKPKATKTALHSKILTDAQIKYARKHGYVNVTIEGVKKRVTKKNYTPHKRTIQWYKSGGKVCLKVVRR